MGKVIAEPKTYSGKDLETIFFRPMLTGPSATELGVNIMLNTPVPVKMQLWKGADDVLKPYAVGFTGGNLSDKYQKEISLKKIKAELSYDPTDYFGMVNELITNSAKYNLGDLQGSPLEKAETYLFSNAIRESIRVTSWLGKYGRTSASYATIDGWIQRLMTDSVAGTGEESSIVQMTAMSGTDAAETLFKTMFRAADQTLQDRKGELAFYVTTDVLNNYEDTLTSANLEGARTAMIDGVKRYFWNGIPIIDLKLTNYLSSLTDMPQSFCLLTVVKNLNLAVNTNILPDGEVRMWFNEDALENRQRAIFMMGCDYIEPKLTILAAAVSKPATPTVTVPADNTTVTIGWTAHPQTSIYNVYQNGVKIATVTTNSKAITGLTKDTAYNFTIVAVLGGSQSVASDALTVTTTNV